MVDAADLKSVGCNGRASSSLATPTINFFKTSGLTINFSDACGYPGYGGLVVSGLGKIWKQTISMFGVKNYGFVAH